MRRPLDLSDFNDEDENNDDVSTEETLELIADILTEGTVQVQVYPEFLREVADEIRALKKTVEELRREWDY